MRYYKIQLVSSALAVGGLSSLLANDSITANYHDYLSIAQRASEDPSLFKTFRSFPEYSGALEITDGETFAEYIRCNLPKLGIYIENCRKLDAIGNPILSEYPELGLFSATTLRYIFHADQILKYFTLPQEATVVEIGAGFGGQAHILQTLHPCRKYYIYDLSPVEALISTMMQALDWPNIHCLPIDESMPEDSIDLLISNYAYSECDREMQLSYFDRIIKRAKRGYMIYNKIAITDYGMDSMSPSEFIELLKKSGFKPRAYKEFFTGAGNILILWDKTR